MKIFTWLQDWWENKKDVVMDFVLPKLDLAYPALLKFLISKGVPNAIAVPVAKEVISWIKEYLKDQV